MDIKIQEDDIRPYKKRRYRSVKVITILCIIILFIARKEGNIFYAIIPVSLLFVVQYFKSTRSDKYLLTELKVDNKNLSIIYFDKNELKHVNGDINQFKVKKKYEILNKTATPYLVIYYNDVLLLRQYCESTWTEKSMDEVVDYIKKEKILFNSPVH